MIDPDAESGRDRRRQNLTGKLRHGSEPTKIVDRADDAGNRCTEENPPHLARQVEEGEGRDEDPQEDREAAEPGDRPPVETTLIRVVDDAEQARHSADRRRQEDNDQEGDRSAVQDLRVGPKLVHTVYFVP